MFTIAMAAVVIVMTVIVVKAALDQRKELAAFKAKHEKELKVVDTSKQFVILHTTVVIFSLVLAVGTLVLPTLTEGTSRVAYLIVTLGIAVFYFLNLILSKDCEKLYITKESIYIDGREIRFSSIKEVDIKRMGTHLNTYSGESIRITKEKALAIKEAIAIHKQEKNEKKKKH
ncbi:MAG: hypothetical protein HUJ56_12560 [Erysipelotrichaceae bacterium]|nr:hypothetical protein [Erysipelotrichaceae bacterium]